MTRLSWRARACAGWSWMSRTWCSIPSSCRQRRAEGPHASEAGAGDREVAGLVEPLHDPATSAAVRAERRLMADLEGGCRLPIGALARPRADGALHLLGGLAHDDGSLSVADALGRLEAPEELADGLAERLRNPGAGEQRRV